MKAVYLSKMTNLMNFYKRQEIYDKITKYAQLYPQPITYETMGEHKEALKEADVIFSTWGMPALTEQEITDYLPNLKAVFYAAGSVQNFARPFLNKGITVMSAWTANGIPVAEYTLSVILLSLKGFFRSATLYKENNPKSAKEYSLALPGCYDVNIGLLGAGVIGKKVIELLKPFKINTYVFDPFMSEETAKELGVRKLETIDEIFQTCHIVSNHLANLPATKKMITYTHFSKMPPYGVFINTGRAAQLIEKDLIQALNEDKTRYAILDVFDIEPLPNNHPYISMENVMITPHIAGSQREEVARMMDYAADEFVRMVNNEPLLYKVTLEALETMA